MTVSCDSYDIPMMLAACVGILNIVATAALPGALECRAAADSVIRLLQKGRIQKFWRQPQDWRQCPGIRMTLFSSPIMTAIVTVIVTAAASTVTSASAQVLTVCAAPAQSSAVAERPASRALADVLIPLSGQASAAEDALIALWQDDNGFDILVNWGESDEHSLRAEGAQILGMAPSPEFIHLMVAHSDGGLEHFLFSLDASGAGELLRSLAGDAPGSDEESNAICVKPH